MNATSKQYSLSLSSCVQIAGAALTRSKLEFWPGSTGFGDVIVNHSIAAGQNLATLGGMRISSNGPPLVVVGELAKKSWAGQVFLGEASITVIEYF